MVKLDENFHVTKQGIVKKNPAKKITKNDIAEASKAGQKAADDKFRVMVGAGDQYVITNESDSSKQYKMLGLCGLVWIYFRGIKTKNALIKAGGIRVSKNYYGGYNIFFTLKCPAWAIKLHPDAYACYNQSIDLKSAGYEGFLDSMQSKGLMMDAYVDSRMD